MINIKVEIIHDNDCDNAAVENMVQNVLEK